MHSHVANHIPSNLGISKLRHRRRTRPLYRATPNSTPSTITRTSPSDPSQTYVLNLHVLRNPPLHPHLQSQAWLNPTSANGTPPSSLCCYTILYTRNKASNTYTNTPCPQQTKQLPPRRTSIQSLGPARRNNRHIRQCAGPDTHRQHRTSLLSDTPSSTETHNVSHRTTSIDQSTNDFLVRVLLQLQHNTKRQRDATGPHGVAR
jgi:hypothetical protein